MNANTKPVGENAIVHMTLHDFEVQLRKAYAEGRYDGHSLGEAESLEWVTEDWQRSHTKARLELVRSELRVPNAHYAGNGAPWRLTLEDGTLWPNPEAVASASWKAMHGAPTEAELSVLTAAADAYAQLCREPRMTKKLPMIRRAAAKLRELLNTA